MGQPPLRATRLAGLLAALAAVALGFAAQGAVGLSANGALVGKNEFAHLEGCAKELAAKGCAAEVADLLDVMTRLGDDGAALAKTRDACSKSLDKVKAKPPASGAAVASIARTLHSCASDMTKLIAALDAKDAATLAEQILRVDDEQPLAHETLGQVFEKPANAKAGAGAWTTPEQQRLAKRREIERRRAGAQASHRDRALRTRRAARDRPSPAVVVRYGNVQFHSTMAPEKLQRIVRRGLRDGVLQVPARPSCSGACHAQKTSHKFGDAFEARAMREGGRARCRDQRTQGRPRGRGPRARPAIDERGFYVEQSLRRGELPLLRHADDGARVLPGERTRAAAVPGRRPPPLALPHPLRQPAAGHHHDPKDAARGGQRRASARDAREEKRARDVAARPLRRAALDDLRGAARTALVELVRRRRLGPSTLDLVKRRSSVEYLQESCSSTSCYARPRRIPETTRPLKRDRAQARRRARRLRGALPRLAPAEADAARPARSPSRPPPTTSRQRREAAASRPPTARKLAWDSSKYGAFAPMQIDRELSNACALHVRYLKLTPTSSRSGPTRTRSTRNRRGSAARAAGPGPTR
jgi:hypothetical protein